MQHGSASREQRSEPLRTSSASLMLRLRSGCTHTPYRNQNGVLFRMSRPYCSLLFPCSRVNKKSDKSQLIENKEQDERSGEPRRTRTSNPLITPETLCSWLFLHFLARCTTVFHGVWQGFVPKVVPNFRKGWYH